jgi:DnaK suppressor protein
VDKVAEFTKFLQQLKAEKARLLQEMEQIQTSQQTAERRAGGPFGKRGEEASQVLELEKRLDLEKRLKKALAEIDHALEKYEAGTYGLCDSCGKPIEPARLEALPQANLCLGCKVRQTRDAK